MAGAILGFLGVGAGAFGAHVLSDRIPPASLIIYETAVRYHVVHALALIVIGALGQRSRGRSLQVSGWAFLVGVIVFSGSLYALAVLGMRWLGAVTPFGGVAFLVGWAGLAWAGWRIRSSARGEPN